MTHPGYRLLPADDPKPVLDAMRRELTRSREKLRIPGFEAPYFISYLVRDFDVVNIWGNYGSLYYYSPQERYRNAYVEVRVGDYKFDNFIDGGLTKNLVEDESFNHTKAPIGSDAGSLRESLWRLTDIKYKEALDQFLRKKGRMLKEVLNPRGNADFTKEKAHRFIEKPRELDWPIDHWEDLVRKCSAWFRRFRHLTYSWLQITCLREGRFLVNTDGSEIYTHSRYYQVLSSAQALAKDGMPLTNSWRKQVRRLDEFPREEEILESVEEMVRDLMHLREAKVMAPYSGPAILSPESAAVFFHEAVGHRLEGERLISDEEGHTFLGKLGKKILPGFINVSDDPTLEEWEGESVWGSYRYDDEGIPSQRVSLVENGVLKNFLLSRTPVKEFEKSNGHGRNQTFEDPMARMAVLMVKPSKTLTREKLEARLIAECRKQKKPYGLIINIVQSGETNTQRHDFQAFCGTPSLIYRVDLDSGKKTLVRGVEFIGTPLMSINKVIAAGDDLQARHSFCSAESGWVPITTIAPSILVGEIELQRIKDRHRRQPILPPPSEAR